MPRQNFLHAHHRRGSVFGVVLAILGLLILAAGAWVIFGSGSDAAPRASAADLFAARHGSFDITVPATGELQALQQIEIKNELEIRAVITEIVPEGTQVKAGDILFRLNDEELRDELKTAENELESAMNDLNAARATLEITRSTRESELDKADLAVKLADLALKSWEDGEDVAMREELDLARRTAKMNLERLKERFEASKELLDLEFISEDEYKQDEIALMEADARFTQAERDILVYNTYTRVQQYETKTSDLEQAVAERQRIEARMNNEVESAESDVRTRERQRDLRQERYDKLLRQISYCIVRAPSDGLVVYNSSLEDGRRDEEPPQVGTELHRNETVIVLPDTSRMIAEVKVNEALSGQIDPGQRALVTTDARSEQVLTGQVLNVGVLAESGGWRDPNRRDYTVRILLDGENSWGLKPSMRCKANIHVGRAEDTVYVPIQAVFRRGRSTYVWIPGDGGYRRQEIETGVSSELYVAVHDGLEKGALVLLREPRPEERLESELDDAEMPGGGLGPSGIPQWPGRSGEGGSMVDRGPGDGDSAADTGERGDNETSGRRPDGPDGRRGGQLADGEGAGDEADTPTGDPAEVGENADAPEPVVTESEEVISASAAPPEAPAAPAAPVTPAQD